MPYPENEKEADAAFDEGLRALGTVVYFFQQLEDELRRVLSFLIDPEDSTTADIVVCEQSFKQLVALADALFAKYAEANEKGARQEWRALLGRALQAERDRNAILHSTFGVWTEDPPVFCRLKSTAKFRKGFKEHTEALDPNTVQAYVSKITTVEEDICDFMGRVFPKWNTREWTRDRPDQ